MIDKLYHFRPMFLIIIIPILLSCATTQQKQGESKDAKSYDLLGITHLQKGDYDQAIYYFSKWIEMDPKKPEAYNWRGIAYNFMRQYDRAISDFTKSIEMDPKIGMFYCNRGRSYYFKKEYDKSWDDIKKAQDLGYQDSPEFLNQLRKASGRQN